MYICMYVHIYIYIYMVCTSLGQEKNETMTQVHGSEDLFVLLFRAACLDRRLLETSRRSYMKCVSF